MTVLAIVRIYMILMDRRAQDACGLAGWSDCGTADEHARLAESASAVCCRCFRGESCSSLSVNEQQRRNKLGGLTFAAGGVQDGIGRVNPDRPSARNGGGTAARDLLRMPPPRPPNVEFLAFEPTALTCAHGGRAVRLGTDKPPGIKCDSVSCGPGCRHGDEMSEGRV